MDKIKISFTVSKNIANMFVLASSMANLSADTAFELLAKKFAAETLQKMQLNDKNDDKSDDSGYEGYSPVDIPPPINIISYNNPTFPHNVEKNNKVEKKIALWARRLGQINAQIIKAYFICSKNGIASRKEMRKQFLLNNLDKNSKQFEDNLNSMATDKGNSHGHVFDFYGDEVHVADGARDVLIAHKHYFQE